MKRTLFLIITILAITIKGAIAQGENLVKDGSFENVTRINSDFNYVQPQPANGGWGHGSYTITDQVVSKWGKAFVDPVTSSGKFFIVDVSKSKKQRLWYDSITVKPNTTYSFTCIVANVYAPHFDNNQYAPREATPILQLNVNEKRVSRIINLYSNWNDEFKTEWKTISGEFTSGPDQTRIEISIVDKEWGITGNDVAVDNISFVEKETVPPAIVKDKKKKDEKEVPPVVAVLTEPVKEIPPVVVKEEPPIVVPPPVIKEEPSVVIKEEPEAVIPPVVKKEEPEIVTPPPVKKEAPVVIPPVIKKEPKLIPPKVVQPKIIPPKVVQSKTVQPKIIPPKIIKPKVVQEPKKEKPPVVKEKSKPEKPKAFTKDITISDIQVDEKLELSHIYFEKGKYHLLPTSIPELKGLMDFMNKYKTVRIRLEGHTESGGDPVKNILLSENRVKEVKKYLVENGIETGRIEWVGHGGNKPLNIDGDEETKKLNRRVEVVVIGK